MMRTLRTAAAILMTASMLLITAPVAAQAAGNQYVTRGQYVQEILQAVGIAPTPNARQSFTDVPRTSPYFGYVEAAVAAGITTGMTKTTFGVNQDLTRAEAAAFDLRAYSGEVAYFTQTEEGWKGYATYGMFSDAEKIPMALQGDVYNATKIGLLQGFPNGSFGPLQNLTQGQAADLVQQMKKVLAVSNSGPIQWRFIVANQGPYRGVPTTAINMQQAETAAVHIGDILAAAVQDKPFALIAQYVEPSQVAAVEQQFGQLEQAFQSQDVPAGIHWRVLGMSNGLMEANTYPSTLGGGAYIVEPVVDIQSISTVTGQPVTLPKYLPSPNFFGPAPSSSVLSLNVPTGLGSDGLVTNIGSAYYRLYDMYVTQAQAKDQALAVFFGSGTSIGDADLGSAIAVSGN